MIKLVYFLLLFLDTQDLSAQSRILSPAEATELILSNEFNKVEPVKFNLDSEGEKIIRQYFYDKANYPDQVSKKDYLDKLYMDSWERKNQVVQIVLFDLHLFKWMLLLIII